MIYGYRMLVPDHELSVSHAIVMLWFIYIKRSCILSLLVALICTYRTKVDTAIHRVSYKIVVHVNELWVDKLAK